MRSKLLVSVAAALLWTAQVSTGHTASIVTEWLDEVLPAANEVAWEPTVGARFVAIVYGAMYDAWTAYDPIAVGYVSGTALKGEGGASNVANKREAVSYAAYTTLRTLAPQRRRALADWMRALGYEPNASTASARVGRRAALAVLAACAEDGANAAADFADTTGYAPKRSAPPDAWRPIDHFGRPQLPTTPQWGRVEPFALTQANQFRPPPPPAPGTAEWVHQIDVLIDASRDLTDAQKAAAEYWAPWGGSPAPHLLELTKLVSNSNDQRLDEDIKLFFVAANALLDASIATWEAKYVYDYVRPITPIHALGEKQIVAWHPRSLPTAFAYSAPLTRGIDDTGAGAGTGAMRADAWEPYLPTPPFPAYVSGHSAFTAAWARVMELATGSTSLNLRVSVHHLFVEQRELTPPVTLFYPTFASAADASGMSRIWGGIHWPADNEQGQILGRTIGETAWERAQQFFLGTASPASAVVTTLRSPFWFPEGGMTVNPQLVTAGAGLPMRLAPDTSGTWRSIAVDPVPAGTYELKLAITVTGNVPVRLRAAVETPDTRQELLGTASAVAPAGAVTMLGVPWTSDGVRSFRFSVEAQAGHGEADVLISALHSVRTWPVVAGSARYYEMRSAGLPDRTSQAPVDAGD
jgi:Domain of unknown function (DUF6851)/VCPO second helical-bundle domain